MYVRDARSPSPSSEHASFVMSRNRARDTVPERTLRRSLWAAGLRGYRLHPRGVPGRPDVVYPRAKVAIFVHGCFWHGCPRHGRTPRSNASFWAEKVRRNQERDRRKEAELRRLGWIVLEFWEHDVMGDATAAVVGKVEATLSARRS